MQREPESAADARFALDTDFRTHGLHQALGDRQSEAGASVFAREGRIGLLECGEQAPLIRFADADACVTDLEA